jgi:hypothetical protein
MKKVLHGLMAAAVTLGLAAAPAFAAVSPRVETGSNIVKVQQTTKTTKKKRVAKKAPAKKKTQTAKKAPAKKKPAAG